MKISDFLAELDREASKGDQTPLPLEDDEASFVVETMDTEEVRADLDASVQLLDRVRDFFFFLDTKTMRAQLDPVMFRELLRLDKDINDFLDPWEIRTVEGE